MQNSLETRVERLRTLDGFTLKWIAVASMLIDHIGFIIMNAVLAPYYTGDVIMFTADMPFIVRYTPAIKAVCDALGSVAFPVFCFLLAEGFSHTKNPLKYGLRMWLFALISEIPFDLAHFSKPFDFRLQNVLFTLCIGIFTLCAVSQIAKRYKGNTLVRVLGSAAAIAAGAGLAYYIRSEYVFLGIASIALFYILRERKYWRLLGLAPLLVASPWVLLAIVPIALYSGKRGAGSKYFFYVFYPAHFLALAGLAQLIAGRSV